MAENKMNDNEKKFYEGVAQVADFIYDRQGGAQDPNGLNNTVEEYVEDDKEE